MNSIILPIIYSCCCSIFITFLSKFQINKLKYILFLFCIQISGLIHELAHFSVVSDNALISINSLFYIPIIGLLWSFDVKITFISITQSFLFGSIGFIVQFIYLFLFAILLFNKSIFHLLCISICFNIYLFIYGYVNYFTNTSDFYYWVKN